MKFWQKKSKTLSKAAARGKKTVIKKKKTMSSIGYLQNLPFVSKIFPYFWLKNAKWSFCVNL